MEEGPETMYELGGMAACHQRTSGHELAVATVKPVPLRLPHMTRISRSYQHCITNGECMSSIPPWLTDSCHLVRARGDALYDLPMRMQESLTKLRGLVTHKKEGHGSQKGLLGKKKSIDRSEEVRNRVMGWEQSEFIICGQETVKAKLKQQETPSPLTNPNPYALWFHRCLHVLLNNTPTVSIKLLCDKVHFLSQATFCGSSEKSQSWSPLYSQNQTLCLASCGLHETNNHQSRWPELTLCVSQIWRTGSNLSPAPTPTHHFLVFSQDPPTPSPADCKSRHTIPRHPQPPWERWLIAGSQNTRSSQGPLRVASWQSSGGRRLQPDFQLSFILRPSFTLPLPPWALSLGSHAWNGNFLWNRFTKELHRTLVMENS